VAAVLVIIPTHPTEIQEQKHQRRRILIEDRGGGKHSHCLNTYLKTIMEVIDIQQCSKLDHLVTIYRHFSGLSQLNCAIAIIGDNGDDGCIT